MNEALKPPGWVRMKTRRSAGPLKKIKYWSELISFEIRIRGKDLSLVAFKVAYETWTHVHFIISSSLYLAPEKKLTPHLAIKLTFIFLDFPFYLYLFEAPAHGFVALVIGPG